jgi:hypothetical protein
LSDKLVSLLSWVMGHSRQKRVDVRASAQLDRIGQQLEAMGRRVEEDSPVDRESIPDVLVVDVRGAPSGDTLSDIMSGDRDQGDPS